MSVKALAISCWLVVASILGLVCFLTAGVSEGAERATTGFIPEDTRVCVTSAITPDAVSMFTSYNRLITRLEEVGIEGLTQGERMLGAFLTNADRCGTVAQDYRVVVLSSEGDYILLTFDDGYGFVPMTYITFSLSFVADTLL